MKTRSSQRPNFWPTSGMRAVSTKPCFACRRSDGSLSAAMPPSITCMPARRASASSAVKQRARHAPPPRALRHVDGMLDRLPVAVEGAERPIARIAEHRRSPSTATSTGNPASIRPRHQARRFSRSTMTSFQIAVVLTHGVVVDGEDAGEDAPRRRAMTLMRAAYGRSSRA